MPVPKTGGLPLADVPSTQNYTDGERDLETAISISSLDAPPGGTPDDRFVTVPRVPSSRQPPPPRVRRFAVDDVLAEFDDFDEDEDLDSQDIDDGEIEDEDGFDYDEDEEADEEFEDAFAGGDGGPGGLLTQLDCVSASGREPRSRKTAGLRNQSLSNS